MHSQLAVLRDYNEREIQRKKNGLTAKWQEKAKDEPPTDFVAKSSEPLRADLEFRVWGRGHVGDPIEMALPIVNHDRVRLEAVLNQPAHVFLLWIDAKGEVQIVTKEGAVESLSLTGASPSPTTMPITHLASPPRQPGKPLEGWEITGEPGIETALLLARRTPLPPDQSLVKLLSKHMPKQWPSTSGTEIVWLEVDRKPNRRVISS